MSDTKSPVVCACLDCFWFGMETELSAQACPECDGRVADHGSPEFDARSKERVAWYLSAGARLLREGKAL